MTFLNRGIRVLDGKGGGFGARTTTMDGEHTRCVGPAPLPPFLSKAKLTVAYFDVESPPS